MIKKRIKKLKKGNLIIKKIVKLPKSKSVRKVTTDKLEDIHHYVNDSVANAISVYGGGYYQYISM